MFEDRFYAKNKGMEVKRPIRVLVYLSILAVSGYLLSPALSINPNAIGNPVKGFMNGWNSWELASMMIAVALLMTYGITSRLGLLVLGTAAFFALMTTAILYPYLFPLLIPMGALWISCAFARRKAPPAQRASGGSH